MRKLLLLLMAALFLLGCEQTTEDGETEPDIVESGTTAEPAEEPAQEPPGRVIQAEGQLVASKPILSLSFETSGRLLELGVKPGDHITHGDLVATLDDSFLQDAVITADLQVAAAENSLAQAQLALDNLLNWVPAEMAVRVAEANLAAARATLAQIEAEEANAGNSLTSANIQIAQAQRFLADVQEAYDTAHDPARDWELNDPWRSEALKAEREATTRSLQEAGEALTVAYANYSVTAAGLNNELALINAQTSIISAEQALDTAVSGPKESDIAAGQLQVAQAEIALQQSQFSLQQAQAALSQARLVATGSGTVLTVSASPGETVGAGVPIITLQNTDLVEFHTLNLSERDLAQVMPGQPATINLRSYVGTPLKGQVVRIVPQAAGEIGGAAVFTVVITLDAPDLLLLPGMTGQVEIVSES